jgi:HAD superfamily hydrolase (TIGR01509 family)
MKTPVRALLFDFDGLILDTETPEVDVWKRIYSEYGFLYPVHLWVQNVGMWGNQSFDPVGYLHELTHDSLNMDTLRTRHRDESTLLIEQQPVGAGLESYLTRARRLGLRLAVASSSPRYWVTSHLTRLGLVSRFDHIITGDDVAPGRTKPHPDIYLRALQALGVTAEEAIAFEDSPPGLAAARSAGIYAVAVPNPTTAQLDLHQANLAVKSLASLSLDELLQRKDMTGNV